MSRTAALTPRRRSLLCWLTAAAMASLLYLGLWLLGAEIRYGTTDDSHIMNAFMGLEAGLIPQFHVFLHGLLTYPLYWVSTVFPGVPWFSVLQIVLLWLACTVAVKSLLQGFLQYGHSFGKGLAVSVLYLLAYGMEYCCHVTFTVTAAMLGAAAVAQLLSIDYANVTDGSMVRSMVLSLVMVVLAYALRQITALPILAFCALAFAVGFRRRRQGGHKPLRPFAWVMVLVAVVMGGLMAQREWDIDRSGAREYLHWQQATGSILDYVGFADVPMETTESFGWSPAERELVEQWYMLDENITAEACDTLYEQQLSRMDRSLTGRIRQTLDTLQASFRWEKLFRRTIWLLLAVALFSLLALIPRKGDRLWPSLMVLAGVLLAFALLLYLAAKGRMPQRAMLMTVLPAAALLFGLLPGCLSPSPSSARGKGLRLAAFCACAALTLWYAIPEALTYAPKLPDEEAGETNIYEDLYEFALTEPDMLVIYDLTLFADTRMFPDLSEGTPQNLVCWGTWTARSPGMYKQFEDHGIDGRHFTAADFLRENICFASVTLDPPPETLLAYLRAELGEDVDFDYYTSWGGVHVFTFYQ